MQDLATMTEQSDRGLVDLARLGDKDAFGELVWRHYRGCVARATFFLRNHWDAEDQVQIACSKAHEHLFQYQGEAEFASWLFRIVTNQCLMFMRKKQRVRFLYLDDRSGEPEAQLPDLPACGPDPEGELGLNELKQVLRTEIWRVPVMLRNVMLLHDIQELPMTDVAAALQISVPAAKSRLLRGRIELRRRLKRLCENIGSTSPASRSAAPVNRVARRSSIRPLVTTGT